MKIFNWLKSKLHGKDNTIKPEPESLSYHATDEPCKGEFSGCPSTLLAIGTLGNNLKHSSGDAEIEEILPSSGNHKGDTTVEEFDRELRRLLHNHHCSLDSTTFSGESEHFDIPLEKILESLPEDEEIGEELISASENEDALLQRTISAVHTGGTDNPSCNRKKGIYRKSISFLLKKAFLCGGGFVPSPIISPILKDPFPDSRLDRSRMEKILRTVLRKKRNPHRQKYLDRPAASNNEEQGEASNGNNWVKTDSEYISLEL